jgi:hypothetical protein
MLNDVYNCFGQIDWTKFQTLEAEMLTKYAVEGRLLRQINAATPPWARGFGAGTDVFHTAGGFDPSHTGSAGGAFANRQSPFGLIDYGISQFNRVVGPYVGLGG